MTLPNAQEMVISTHTVEQLIAGGVYCATYDHEVSMVTPYMSQIALHAYVLYIRSVGEQASVEDTLLSEAIADVLESYTADNPGDRYELSIIRCERVIRILLSQISVYFRPLLLVEPVIDYRCCTLQHGFGAYQFVKLDNDMRHRKFGFQTAFSGAARRYNRSEDSVLSKSNVEGGSSCECYMPTDKQNPGFDSVEALQSTDGSGRYLILFENKFSAENATTRLNWMNDVVNKAKKTRTKLLSLGWSESQFVLVVTSWREVDHPSKAEVREALDSVPNYIVLTREEQRQRLGATLSGIIDAWSDAEVTNLFSLECF
jgi:hypothetical protein